MTLRKSILVALAATISIAVPLQAQAQVQGLGILALDPVAEGNTVLAISGNGQVVAAPDLAKYMVGVNTAAETATEAAQNNAATMTRVIAELKKLGVAEQDIRTSNLTITPLMSNNYDLFDTSAGANISTTPALLASIQTLMDALNNSDGTPKSPAIIGYRASNQIIVKQRDLSEYGTIVDRLFAAGANQILGPNFSLSEPAPLYNQATAKAVADAQQRAQIYASAAGMRLVRVIMFEEKTPYGSVADGSQGELANYDTVWANAYTTLPMQSGDMVVSSTVNVLFELAPR